VSITFLIVLMGTTTVSERIFLLSLCLFICYFCQKKRNAESSPSEGYAILMGFEGDSPDSKSEIVRNMS